MCLRLVSPFVAHPPLASILDPPCSFLPAGCRVSIFAPPPPLDAPPPRSLLAVSLTSTSTSTSVKVVIVVIPAAPSPLSLTSSPVVSSQSSTVILFFRSACCLCTRIQKNLVQCMTQLKIPDVSKPHQKLVPVCIQGSPHMCTGESPYAYGE